MLTETEQTLFEENEKLRDKLAAMTAAKNKAVGALKRCRNYISGDPTYGACPMSLDELIAELEEVK